MIQLVLVAYDKHITATTTAKTGREGRDCGLMTKNSVLAPSIDLCINNAII